MKIRLSSSRMPFESLPSDISQEMDWGLANPSAAILVFLLMARNKERPLSCCSVLPCRP